MEEVEGMQTYCGGPDDQRKSGADVVVAEEEEGVEAAAAVAAAEELRDDGRMMACDCVRSSGMSSGGSEVVGWATQTSRVAEH